MDARANARAAAIRRTGGGKAAAKPSSKQGGAENFAFFSGSSNGFEVSPKAVLIISLVYIGIVVLLHIFGKVSSSATASS
mmetsp:Transcript_680/g.791  ORF Transcript_680/g.791 Transcript_680/m.791 type:complete len:80 (+) Transcript_680:25-264(+)